jgi:CheY-like chemotaxis protein
MATSRRILLVDDDPDFILQQKIPLEAAGHEVKTAASRQEAEALFEQERFDAAIIDLMMQEVDDGFALSYHIKKKSPETVVILASAVSSETGMEFDAATDEERSWVKADAFLAKPIRFEQLEREMERLLPA